MAIDLLQIQPHKVSRDLSGYITYIYGPAKVGKTSLAAQADNCLLIATERGYNAIGGIRAIDVTSWSEMRQVYRELKKPEVKAQYKVLIVDTIDLAAKYCTTYICSQNNIQDLSELGYGKGHAKMRSEFENIFNSLTQMGYSVIFISHAQDKIITRPDGTEYSRIVPSLSPDKVNTIVENMADIYGYAHFSKDAEGNPIRVLTLRSNDDSIACGCRFRYIEPEIPLGYKSLVDALNKAIDKEEEFGGESVVTNDSIQPIGEQIDYQADMEKFNILVSKLQEVTGNQFANRWAPYITATVEKYLGIGKRISDSTPRQAEQVHLIVLELEDEVGKGI